MPVKNQLIFSISKIANQRRERLLKSLASWPLFLLVQLLFCITNLQAQTEFIELRFDQKDAPKKAQYFLTGKVSQLETKEAIPGAAIHIDGFFKGNNTDQNRQIVKVDHFVQPCDIQPVRWRRNSKDTAGLVGKF